jgi:sugar phosphate isomerase/epimerase
MAMLNRREFLGATLGVGAAMTAFALPGDKFRWACTSGMFRVLNPQPEITLQMIAKYGFHGLEATVLLADSAGSVAKFRQAMDAHNLAVATFWGGGVYWDPANPARVKETVANNIMLARDYIAPCGGKYLKVNLNNVRDAHPAPDWMTPLQMRELATTLNEIGRGTKAAGVKFAFHPHNWTLIESDKEVRQIMELTDPSLVYMIADTAHLTLGGLDPVKFMRDWFPRIAGVHFKDTEPKYSVAKAGWKGPAPTREEHTKVNLYKNFGAGGVDFAGFMQVLREKGYDSWISLDFDPLRPGEGDVDGNMSARKKYLVETLKASLRS